MKKNISPFLLFLFLALLHPNWSNSQNTPLAGGFCVPYDSIVDSTVMESFPWFGDEYFLPRFLDSLGFQREPSRSNGKSTSIIGGPSTAIMQIPVKAYLVADNIGGLSSWQTPANVSAYIRNVNKIFEETGTRIRFFLKCEITTINNSNLAFDVTGADLGNNANIYRENGAITLFCVREMSISDPLPTGLTANPWSSSALYGNIGFTIAFDGSELPPALDVALHLRSIGLAHEFGHALGLLHTHYGYKSGIANFACTPCRQEAVSRTRTQGLLCDHPGATKCTITGDALCDTDADPLLYNTIGGPFYNACTDSTSCTYSGCNGTTDQWGDTWNPPTHNIMSWGHYGCMDDFSNGQIGVMHYYSLFGMGAPGLNPKVDFNSSVIDVLEPDNVAGAATEMLEGDLQYHTFHFQPIPSWDRAHIDRREQCDMDWAKFTLTSPDNPIRLFTAEVPGQPQPKTLMKLYDDAMNLIGASYAYGGSNFSEIHASLPAGTYFVSIQNPGMLYPTPEARGHYYVGFETCTYCCESTIFPVPASMSSPADNFNLGARYTTTTEYIPHNVVVQNSNLSMNDNLPIGYFAGSGPLPEIPSLLEVKLCASKITINNGGNLFVGHRWNRKANLHIGSGSILELKTGSHTYIRNSSSIVIEPGGKLIVEPGAFIDIELRGFIDQSGTLSLLDNAVFTFTGDGHIEWGATTYPGQVITGVNTSIKLVGTGTSNQLLVVKDNALFYPDVSLQSLEISNGLVEMGENALINTSDADLNLQSLNVVAINPARMHRGIQVNGQLIHTIKNVDISHGTRGITAFQMWNEGATLRLTKCNFHDCKTALRVHTKGTFLTLCNFNNNEVGYEQLMGSVSSVIQSCSFNNNVSTGIQFNSAPADLYVRESTADYNKNGIIFNGTGTLFSKCSSSSWNSNAGIGVSFGGTLDLGNNLDPAGSQHKSIGNSYSVIGLVPRYFNFREGKNDLVPAVENIGRVVYAWVNTPPAAPIYWRAEQNHWNTRGTTTVGDAPAYITDYLIANFFSGSVTTPVYLTDPVRALPFSYCTYGQLGGGGGGSTALRFCSTCRSINTATYQNVPLNQAVLDAIEQMSLVDTTKSDSTALSRLYEIIKYPIANPTLEEKEVLDAANSFAKSAFSSALASREILPVGINGSNNSLPYHQMVENLLAAKVQATGVDPFQPILDLILLSHATGELDSTLEGLDSLIAIGKAGYEDYLEFSDCYITLVKAVANGALQRDKFEDALAHCSMFKWETMNRLTDGSLEKFAEGLPKELRVAVSPSPADADIWVDIESWKQEPTVSFCDIQGRFVEVAITRTMVSDPVYQFHLNTSKLPAGIYMVKVQGMESVVTKKVIVQ